MYLNLIFFFVFILESKCCCSCTLYIGGKLTVIQGIINMYILRSNYVFIAGLYRRRQDTVICTDRKLKLYRTFIRTVFVHPRQVLCGAKIHIFLLHICLQHPLFPWWDHSYLDRIFFRFLLILFLIANLHHNGSCPALYAIYDAILPCRNLLII